MFINMRLLALFQICCFLVVSVAYAVNNSAVESEIARHVLRSIKPKAFQDAHNFNEFHAYEVIVDLMKNLKQRYSAITKLEVLGKSYEYRPIYNMKISSGDSSSKPIIIIECGIHANEYASVSTGSYIANKLVTSYGSDSEITALVDKYEFNIIINVNPDGYIYSWKNDRGWRKNRSRNRSPQMLFDPCRGADLNRNFDVEHCGPKNENKKDTCSSKYCGSKPFSESESRALRDLMSTKKDRIAAYFALHAGNERSGQILTSYGFADWLRPPAWKEDLLPVAQSAADAIRYFSKIEYAVGTYASLREVHYGMSVDYLAYKLNVKYGFVIEMRNAVNNYSDKDVLLHVSQEVFEGIKGALKALK